MDTNNIFFNAHHPPIGAYASFTLGFKGAKGGLGQEMAKPADQNIFIGLQSSDKSCYEALPFFKMEDNSQNIDNIKHSTKIWNTLPHIMFFEDAAIDRIFKLATDTWIAKDLIFMIYSPVRSIPDPQSSVEINSLKIALLPAVLAELTVNNIYGQESRRVYFGYQGNDPYCGMRRLEDTIDNGLSHPGAHRKGHRRNRPGRRIRLCIR